MVREGLAAGAPCQRSIVMSPAALSVLPFPAKASTLGLTLEVAFEPAPAPPPKCPYANHSDSLAHFAVDCPIVATPAHRYLTQCWRLWSGSAPEPAWLKCEWAGVNRGWMLAFACLHHALYAGRMHRLDETHANDSALALLLYVLALFRKLIKGMAEAAVGMIKDPDSLTRRLKKLRWPEKWCNNRSGRAHV